MNESVIGTIRENYNRLADEYARNLFDELRHKPFDCALLDRFAAATAGGGRVCDVGCGPGHVTHYLHDRGTAVFGLDLSPGMLAQARQLNPGIDFEEGDMLSLPLADESLAGITAFYAIVNTSAESLPVVFQEMARVLGPNGLLLLAFHAGDEVVAPKQLWGQPVSMDFFFFPPWRIQRQLEAAGFAVKELLERDPYAPEVEHQSRRCYIFARRCELKP